MHQNLLNAEFMSVWYLYAKNKNAHFRRVIKALTKVLLERFGYIYASRQLHLLGQVNPVRHALAECALTTLDLGPAITRRLLPAYAAGSRNPISS
jgi:hypothetical protein